MQTQKTATFLKNGTEEKNPLTKAKSGNAQQSIANCQGSLLMVPVAPSRVRDCAKFKDIKYLKLILAPCPLSIVFPLLWVGQSPTLPG